MALLHIRPTALDWRVAHIVARRLRDGDPAILLRDYWADSGRLHLDVTCLDDAEVELVGERVHRALIETGRKEEP